MDTLIKLIEEGIYLLKKYNVKLVDTLIKMRAELIKVKTREEMLKLTREIRTKFKFYSQDLINNLFYHPYTKIEFIEKDLGVGRLTAAKYLEELCKQGFLKKQKMGRTNYYINLGLFQVLAR